MVMEVLISHVMIPIVSHISYSLPCMNVATFTMSVYPFTSCPLGLIPLRHRD